MISDINLLQAVPKINRRSGEVHVYSNNWPVTGILVVTIYIVI